MRRDKCGGCASPDLREFLDLGKTPLADEFPKLPSSPDKADVWPLGAAQCGECGLVQLTHVVPDEILWHGDYGFYTGASPSSIAYFKAYADDVALTMARNGPAAERPLVVEIASNDGTFLAAFDESARMLGIAPRCLGVEPAHGPARACAARGLATLMAPFSEAEARSIVKADGRASVIVANNVIAHVADLADFVAGLAVLLADDGTAYIEFQYLGDLLLGNGIDLFYHEHRSFFTLNSLANVLDRAGLEIARHRWTAAQGGSQRVAVRHKRFVGDGAHLPDAGHVVAGMQMRAEMVRDRLRHLIDLESAAGRTVVAYGAPAKATTLLHWCGLTSVRDIAVCYDATPTKAGRYLPGTDIPIVLSANLPARDAETITALVLPHNYLRGILGRERAFMAAGGRLIVPLPVPVVL